MQRVLGFAAVPFLLAGGGMLAGGASLVVDDFDMREAAQRTEGIVVAAPDGGVPVVRFRTGEGQVFQVSGAISASPTPYEVGERIGIHYDAANPQEARIDSFIERWFLPLLLGGLGGVAALVGLGLLSAWWRHRRRLDRLPAMQSPSTPEIVRRQ